MDIKTLVLALALGNLSLCAALFFFEYERKKSLSLSTWAVAKQCQAVAWCLLYFRGVLPDMLSILLGNSLLFAGMALDAAALCLKWREASMLRRFLVVSMGILSLLIAARGVLAAAVPEVDAELLQLAGFGALYLMMLTNAFGYLLLSREKLGGELARLEVLDAATGVPNRRGFYQALAPWMALARRPGLPTALVVLNIDHFKRVNDSYGHPVGDAVLKTIVDTCRQQLRDSDLMGRLGGAEFAIQLPRTTLADALMVAERIRAAVEVLPVKTERAVLQLTASLGVTTIRAEDSTVSLFKRADEALQAAKQAGRNRVVEAQGASTLDS